jgi:hypothetical protein
MSVASGTAFHTCGLEKPALQTPTFDARRRSAMKRAQDEAFGNRVQRAKPRRQACSESVQREKIQTGAKKNLSRDCVRGWGSKGGRREIVALNLRLWQPFFKINRG